VTALLLVTDPYEWMTLSGPLMRRHHQTSTLAFPHMASSPVSGGLFPDITDRESFHPKLASLRGGDPSARAVAGPSASDSHRVSMTARTRSLLRSASAKFSRMAGATHRRGSSSPPPPALTQSCDTWTRSVPPRTPLIPSTPKLARSSSTWSRIVLPHPHFSAPPRRNLFRSASARTRKAPPTRHRPTNPTSLDPLDLSDLSRIQSRFGPSGGHALGWSPDSPSGESLGLPETPIMDPPLHRFLDSTLSAAHQHEFQASSTSVSSLAPGKPYYARPKRQLPVPPVPAHHYHEASRSMPSLPPQDALHRRHGVDHPHPEQRRDSAWRTAQEPEPGTLSRTTSSSGVRRPLPTPPGTAATKPVVPAAEDAKEVSEWIGVLTREAVPVLPPAAPATPRTVLNPPPAYESIDFAAKSV
jgi:hypothetical protein